MKVAEIIQLFGKQENVAEVAGVKQSAVAQWKKHCSIPHKRQKLLLKEARRLELGLTASDFFDD